MVKNDENLKRKKTEETLFILSFMIVPVISFLIFYVYVNFNSILMAFQLPEKGELRFTLENFAWIFDKIKNGSNNPVENLRLAFVNTFKTFGIQIIMFPISLFVSYFIYKKIFGYRVFRVLFYLPQIVSAVVVSFFFIKFCSPENFFPKFLEKISGIDYELVDPLKDPNFANKMIFLNYIWLTFPGNLIVWGGTFSRIPDSVIESARLDGVNWVREMFGIILPLVWPTFVLMVTLQLAGIFGASGNVFLLANGGDYNTQTVANWIYIRVQRSTNPLTSGYLYQASAMGLLLTAVSCIIAVIVRKFLVSRIEETTY